MSAIRSRSIKSIRFLKIFDRLSDHQYFVIFFFVYILRMYMQLRNWPLFILKIIENIFIMTLKTSRLLTNEAHKLKSIKSIDHEKS